MEPNFKVGNFVRIWFDTGAMGATLLYGIVTRSGPKQFTVYWESGLKNRVRYSNGIGDLQRVAPNEMDESVYWKLRGML